MTFQITESLNVRRRAPLSVSWYVDDSTEPSGICSHAFSCTLTHHRDISHLVFSWWYFYVFFKYHSVQGYCLPALKNKTNKTTTTTTKHQGTQCRKNRIAGFETTRSAWGPSLSSAILTSATHAARERSSSLPNTETYAPVYTLSGIKCYEHHICKTIK